MISEEWKKRAWLFADCLIGMFTLHAKMKKNQGNSAVSLLKKFDPLVSYVRNIIVDFQLNTSLQSLNGFLWDNFLYGYQHPT